MFAFGALSEVMGEKALSRTFFKERLEFEVVGSQFAARNESERSLAARSGYDNRF